MKTPMCAACNVVTEKGFIPDHYAKIIQSVWHPGEATEKTLVGNLKLDSSKQIPITAFRCPLCGSLALVAVKTD